MPQLPRAGETFGRYRIDRQLGEGGMGVVHAATDTVLDRPVALKVMSAHLTLAGVEGPGGTAGHEEFLQRFEREAALLARLDSPHVIGIFEAGEHDGCPFIATQLVGGGDLGALIARRGPMPPVLATTVCAQVADALADAHAAGVVHRDVKPTNVLLRDADDPDLHAYLCDFGIARSADDGGLTAAGAVSGTWTYLAPECGQGRPATPSSDLYSVGCLLWATLTGQPPFRGTDVEVAVAHQRAPVPQLQTGGAGGTGDPFLEQVNAILRATLAKDPAERLPDAGALRDALLALAQAPPPTLPVRPLPVGPVGAPGRPATGPGSTTGGRPPGTPTPGPLTPGAFPPPVPPHGDSPRRRAWAVAGAAVAVLAVVGGVVAATTLGGDDDPGRAGGVEGSAGPSDSTSGDPSESSTGEPSESPTESTAPAATSGAGRRGDLDDDGFGDLVVLDTTDEKNVSTTWLSDGEGLNEQETVTLPPTKGFKSRDEVLADTDGDGVAELLEITQRNRPGAPVQVRAVPTDGSEPGPVAEIAPLAGQDEYVTYYPGDADGDGRDDLTIVVWAEDEPFDYFVSLATDDGFTDPRPALQTQGISYDASDTEVGDVDGDGRVDVVVITTVERPQYSYRTNVTVYSGDGRRFTARTRDGSAERDFVTGLAPQLLMADTDGDGDQEVLLADVYASGGVSPVHLLDDRDGRLSAPRVAGLVEDYDMAITVSDVNGDGLDDLVQLHQRDAGARPVFVSAVLARESGDLAAPQLWGRYRLPPDGDGYLSLGGESFP